MSLWSDFCTNRGKVIHKWVHYFPIYERHFQVWRGRSVVFWEIGVSKGGSLQMFQRYFGPMAKIVGIDIDPIAKHHEEPGIFVRIGDQSDTRFLDSVIQEFGLPDVILDDGSHVMKDLWATFSHLYPQMTKNSVYFVEDLHTCYWDEYGGGPGKKESFLEKTKDLIDELQADHSRGVFKPSKFTRETFSICIYDSVVVFEKGDVFRKEAPQRGELA